MQDVYIVGAGMTRFGKFPDRSIEMMASDAVCDALKHAGIDRRQIEAGYVGNAANPPSSGQRIMDYLGLPEIPVFNHENACSASSAALKDAIEAVSTGLYSTVLVVGAEQMTSRIKGLLAVNEGENLLTDVGMVMPAFFALMGRRHMEEYGTTLEQLAQISVKNHKHGALNPFAQYQQEMTLEEVLNSAVIADPITLLQCTPIGDGASALIVTSEKAARQTSVPPVKIEASVFVSGAPKASPGSATIEACVRCAEKAYEEAGIGPEDLDVVELHDCFTAHELLAVEDLGLCPRGEGGRMAVEGTSALGGKIPVNPSGGLLSKGHPIGATGVAQVVELVWQLRNECGKRQVENAKVALAHNGGGIGPGLTLPAMSINILSR